MKYTAQDRKDAYETLKHYRGRRILAVVESVSKSGMSRRIKFYCVIDNDTAWLTPWIAKLLGYSYDQNGLVVKGCGMDMVFHVLSTLNYKMAEIEGKYDVLRTNNERIYDKYFFDADTYTLL